MEKLDAREREGIETLRRVEMFHVSGDRENKTAGLPEAIAEHRRRIDGQTLIPLSLEEGEEIFDAMQHYTPKF